MTLEKRIIVNSFLPDIISALVIFGYVFITTGIGESMSLGGFFNSIKYVLLIIVVAQFLIAPLLDHILYRDISKQVELFDKNEMNENERTELLERLMSYPFVCAIYTGIYFFIGSILLYIIFKFQIHVTDINALLILSECLMGTYFASLYAYNYSNKIFCDTASRVIEAGVNKKYVMTKKYFGAQIGKQMLIYNLIPLIATTAISVFVIYTGYHPLKDPLFWESGARQIQKIVLTCSLNLTLLIILSLLFYKRISNSNKKMTAALETMQNEDLTTAKLLSTDLEDEISYNHYLSNQMLLLFRKILSSSIDIGKSLTRSAQDLIKVSNETEATAVEQSTGTNEIVSTMEGANQLSHDIEGHISEVTELAVKTAEDVSEGSKVLEELLSKTRQIQEASLTTIDGISDLNEKINTIWEIVTIINSIADQTKIIAFNAELEATGVHEGGKNFRNVANEIRHLANSTMDSTKEIKKRINEIQSSAETLIKGTQDSTKQISYGAEISKELEQRFQNIKQSADLNAASAEEIKKLVSQQTAAFEQIVKTLHQISSGIQNFSVSTRSIIDTSNVLSSSAEDLGSINSAKGEAK